MLADDQEEVDDVDEEEKSVMVVRLPLRATSSELSVAPQQQTTPESRYFIFIS
jgi:hypothetical protein